MPHHHPDEDLLLAFAAGSLAEPLAVALETHVALCPLCRGELARLDALGGLFLDELEPCEVSDACRDRLFARLDQSLPPPRPRPTSDSRLPAPLARHVDGPLDEAGWRRFGAVAELDILGDREGFRTRLMKVRAGAAMPQHTHHGMELTLVLAGGFRDEHGHFRRGDFALADSETDHRPIADDDEECLVLVVTDAPLKLTGFFGRFLNPFLRS